MPLAAGRWRLADAFMPPGALLLNNPPRQDVAAKCEAFRAVAAGPRSRRNRQKQIAGSNLFLESE
jgi:hypothetical protein